MAVMKKIMRMKRKKMKNKNIKEETKQKMHHFKIGINFLF